MRRRSTSIQDELDEPPDRFHPVAVNRDDGICVTGAQLQPGSPTRPTAAAGRDGAGMLLHTACVTATKIVLVTTCIPAGRLANRPKIH